MDRQETTRRLELLRSRIDEGKFHVAPHLHGEFQRSLQRIRMASDGLVDEETLDGQIRSTLLAVAFHEDREERKNAISLKQIQHAYFDRVTRVFGALYEMMLKAKVDPYHFSDWYASEPSRAKSALSVVDDFVSEIVEFWENVADSTWTHLEDSLDTKAVFAGEIFPDGQSNVVSSTGIYFDTTVLPDPFLKMVQILSQMSEIDRVIEVVRLALQVLQYRELAVADVAKPLVAILPDRHGLEEDYRDFVQHCAAQDAIRHASRLFGQTFSAVEELTDFLKRYKTSDELVAAMARPDELVYATEWSGNLQSHIDRYIRENGEKVHISHPGQAVLLQLLTRFAQANDSYQRSLELRGTPILRAKTSWLWFDWMLRANALALDPDALAGLHVVRALGTTVSNEITWLDQVPPAALIEIRKTGALDEIRTLLGNGIKELIDVHPANFHRTGDRVFNNIHAAFQAHEAKINELRLKKWKFGGLDVGSFFVVGGIEIAAALTGLPLYGAAAAVTSRLGIIPTAKDLQEKFGKLRQESHSLNSTGIGILFKHKR